MKIKHKIRFIVFLTVYVLGYLFFCIYVPCVSDSKVKDSMALTILAQKADWIAVTPYNMNASVFIWFVPSFFLIIFMIWQTDLVEQKLNRTVLICEGLNLVLICLSLAIVDFICGGDGWSTGAVMIIVLVLVTLGGIALAVIGTKIAGTYNPDSYDAYMDVMTKEEFDRWQLKKHSKKAKFKEIKQNKRDKK